MPSLVNQEQPSDIFHCAHFCVAPLWEQDQASLKLLPSIPSNALMSSAPPLFCTFGVPSAPHSVRQAELRVQRWVQPCVQSGHLKDSQDSNQKTSLIYSVFNPTICNDSWQVKWLFRAAFKPYNDNILQVWPLQNTRETVFLLQIWEGVWESLSAKEWVTQYL